LLHDGNSEFLKIHESPWEKPQRIDNWFNITKHHVSVHEWKSDQPYHVIYFDAFAPEKQPDMWTEDVFLKLFEWLVPGGFLVTYCAKGIVKRTLKTCGFHVQNLPGPPGKREMTQAIKPI
jgi:tRNA U34 5-methylaminomethyl-2-thiouridine-forming methyltransferase MnmC